MRIPVLSLLAFLTALSVAHGDNGPTSLRKGAAISQVTLRTFVLRRPGLLFSLHPTEARIVVTAIANEPLRVCEDGTTFSSHWKRGCLRLARLPLALPTSGGAVHAGFRVMPSSAAPTRVTLLRVRWHCVDHDFMVARGETRVGRASPSFDC
jgi:hypothetical protein